MLIDRAIGLIQRVYQRPPPAAAQLATTAALAEQLLLDDAFGAFEVPDEVRALFRWHELEEREHKPVARHIPGVLRQRAGTDSDYAWRMESLFGPGGTPSGRLPGGSQAPR